MPNHTIPYHTTPHHTVPYHTQAAKKHQARAQIDAQMKQRGNNLHDRGTTPPNRNRPPAKENLSPDDPDR